MDLVKIGEFIAKLRKEAGLTQEQFGEKVGVTNKTVSRWETGTYLPPADVLLEMSKLFSVSINEILSGKRLSAEEYKEAAEANLTQTLQASSFTLKDKIEYYKKKWLKEHIATMCAWGFLTVALAIAGVALSNVAFGCGAMVALFLGHAWKNNAMMTYVENNAYDGTGRY